MIRSFECAQFICFEHEPRDLIIIKRIWWKEMNRYWGHCSPCVFLNFWFHIAPFTWGLGFLTRAQQHESKHLRPNLIRSHAVFTIEQHSAWVGGASALEAAAEMRSSRERVKRRDKEGASSTQPAAASAARHWGHQEIYCNSTSLKATH